MDKLNEVSDNSVRGDVASSHVPNDGTGQIPSIQYLTSQSTDNAQA